MENKKFTKKALFGSVIALILCCAMLVGTTFAWFTDSASSDINTIQSGNLDIVLQHARFDENTELTDWEDVTTTTKLFVNNKGEDILWEPGVHSCEYFRIKNNGNLALKFRIDMIAKNASEVNGKSLLDVLAAYGIFRNVENVEDNRFANLIDSKIPDPQNTEFGVLKNGNFGYEAYLLPGEAIIIEAGAFWEPTDHDNDYNVAGGLTLDLGIELVATQYTYEYDSFENTYDEDAEYPEIDVPETTAPTEGGNEEFKPEDYYKDEVPGLGAPGYYFHDMKMTEAINTDDRQIYAFENVTGDVDFTGTGCNTIFLENCDLDSLNLTVEGASMISFNNVTVNDKAIDSKAEAMKYITVSGGAAITIYGY